MRKRKKGSSRFDWGKAGTTYPVSVVVEAFNRVGLARDYYRVVARRESQPSPT